MESNEQAKRVEGGNEMWPPSKEIMESALANVRGQAKAAEREATTALTPLPDRALTPADMDRMADLAIARVKAFEKVKRAILREGEHYAVACKAHPQPEEKGHKLRYKTHEERGGKDCGEGQVMMKKAGSDALGNGFGVTVLLVSDTLTPENDPQKAVVEVVAEWQGTRRFGRGTCTMNELRGERNEHNLHEKAQTRAEKRAILAVLGSADPIADEE